MFLLMRKCSSYLFLIVCASFIMLLWHVNAELNGSVKTLFNTFLQKGVFCSIYSIWQTHFLGSLQSWSILGVFALSVLFLLRFLPGKFFYGSSLAADGTLTAFKANGFFVFVVMLALYILATKLGLFPATIIYDHFPDLLGALNIFSVCFWIYSSVKEKYLLKKNIDHRMHMFTICRSAMIGWGLALISFGAKQYALYGLADSMILSICLQLIFIAKFFLWEIGYLRTMDIRYDSAGFFLCWGSIVWIPAIYTSPTLYLVHHPNHLGTGFSLLLFLCGISCIFINFLADRQRAHVRSTNGECLIWRKKPDLIFANYRTEWGEEKQNVLLVSGWWGLSRHFHYVPELLGAFFWSIPALFDHFSPYFYLCFLALLLNDRANRHERRCASKYGKDWEKYCEKVPFRIIPFIY